LSPPPQARTIEKFRSNFFINFRPFTDQVLFSVASSFSINNVGNSAWAFGPYANHAAESYRKWLSPALSSPETIPASPLVEIESEMPSEGIDWEDVRIQRWDAPEREVENSVYYDSIRDNACQILTAALVSAHFYSGRIPVSIQLCLGGSMR
jgi:hypothetical protein